MATGGTILPQKRIDRPVPVKESAKRSQPLCPITAKVRRKCRIASHLQRNQAKEPEESIVPPARPSLRARFRPFSCPKAWFWLAGAGFGAFSCPDDAILCPQATASRPVRPAEERKTPKVFLRRFNKTCRRTKTRQSVLRRVWTR